MVWYGKVMLIESRLSFSSPSSLHASEGASKAIYLESRHDPLRLCYDVGEVKAGKMLYIILLLQVTKSCVDPLHG